MAIINEKRIGCRRVKCIMRAAGIQIGGQIVAPRGRKNADMSAGPNPSRRGALFQRPWEEGGPVAIHVLDADQFASHRAARAVRRKQTGLGTSAISATPSESSVENSSTAKKRGRFAASCASVATHRLRWNRESPEGQFTVPTTRDV